MNFYAYDFFDGDEVDQDDLPYLEDDCLFNTFTTELEADNNATVRILIAEGTDRQTALCGLFKLLTVICSEAEWPPYDFSADLLGDIGAAIGELEIFSQVESLVLAEQ